MARRFYFLRDQVNALPRKQFNKLPNWLHTFKPTYYGEADTPAVTLVKFLRGKPEITYEEAFARIGGDTVIDSFRDLCQRTYDRVTAYLISPTHLERKPTGARGNKREYSKAFRSGFEVRNHISKATAVQAYGQHSQAIYHLEQAATIGQKFELYDDTLIALNHLASVYAVTGELDKRASCTELIDSLQQYQRGYSLMRRYYSDYACYVAYPTAPKPFDAVPDLVERATSLYGTAQAPRIGWWYHWLRFEVFRAEGEFAAAQAEADKMLRLALDAPSLQEPRNIGSCFGLLADVQLEQGDYLGASVSYEQALPYYAPDHDMHLSFLSDRALAHCYQNEPHEGLRYIAEAVSRTSADENPTNYALRSFRLAAVQLLCGKVREAYLTLQDTTQLDEDKDGWNIAVRLLSIMTLMERKKLDEASGQIKALRDHVTKYRKANNIPPRMETIVEVLHYWQFTGCHYALTMEHLKAELSALEAAEGSLIWRPNTWEVILFPQWFRSKAESKPYRFVAPPSSSGANVPV